MGGWFLIAALAVLVAWYKRSVVEVVLRRFRR
jgi:hypothetical protein